MILNENMKIIKCGDIEYLTFTKLDELGVINAFTLKGLNFRNRENIHKDYIKILNCLDIDFKQLVKPLAKHTDNIVIIEHKINNDIADINLDYLNEVDGVITCKKDIALATTSADCLCAILYDPVNKVLANIHSGWRGTFKKIIQKALIMMKREFGCDPINVLVFFMPAIRQCHFEVEDDVKTMCEDIFKYTNRIDEIIKTGGIVNGIQKYFIDNILINKILLEEEGVLEENIFDSQLCTVCNSDKLNSRRADGEDFEIATTIAMMK